MSKRFVSGLLGPCNIKKTEKYGPWGPYHIIISESMDRAVRRMTVLRGLSSDVIEQYETYYIIPSRVSATRGCGAFINEHMQLALHTCFRGVKSGDHHRNDANLFRFGHQDAPQKQPKGAKELPMTPSNLKQMPTII